MFVYMPQQETGIHVNYAMVKDQCLVVSNGFINVTERFDSADEAQHWLWRLCEAIRHDQKIFYIRGKQPGED